MNTMSEDEIIVVGGLMTGSGSVSKKLTAGGTGSIHLFRTGMIKISTKILFLNCTVTRKFYSFMQMMMETADDLLQLLWD
jgi:hypothetical protein